MFLSICIPSYNRPNELLRCLESIPADGHNEIEVVVRDDCSPKQNEIIKAINNLVRSDIKLKIAKKNSGFDINFYEITKIASGDYIMYLTDDDYLSFEGFNKYIHFLKNKKPTVCVVPYIDAHSEKIERLHKKIILEGKSKLAPAHIFDFILLSGLTIRRDAIPEYNPVLLDKSIYSQVYIFTIACKKYSPAYFNHPVVVKGEDGENGFSNLGVKLKADRSSYLSNLSFHDGLIKVIKILDHTLSEKGKFLRGFEKEYSLRSYTGLYIAAANGRFAVINYLKMMRKLPIQTGVLPLIYALFIILFGRNLTNMILSLPRHLIFFFRRLSL
jgi:glycosyltransferase involved in cell wall biosynthesis